MNFQQFVVNNVIPRINLWRNEKCRDRVTVDDVCVFWKQVVSASAIEELNTDCGFTLHEGMWYIVKIEKKDNEQFKKDIKHCLDIFPANIICSDKSGNRLLFYYGG